MTGQSTGCVCVCGLRGCPGVGRSETQDGSGIQILVLGLAQGEEAAAQLLGAGPGGSGCGWSWQLQRPAQADGGLGPGKVGARRYWAGTQPGSLGLVLLLSLVPRGRLGNFMFQALAKVPRQAFFFFFPFLC